MFSDEQLQLLLHTHLHGFARELQNFVGDVYTCMYSYCIAGYLRMGLLLGKVYSGLLAT